MRAKLWVTKNYKLSESDISPIYPDAPNGAIVLNFDVRGDIAYIITLFKFYVIRFRGVWSCDTTKSRYLHGIG